MTDLAASTRVGISILLGIVCALIPLAASNQQIFGNDPLPLSSRPGGPVLYNTYMRIDALSNNNIHPAIDIKGADGDSVYCPVSWNDSAYVRGAQPDPELLSVALLPLHRDTHQNGKWAQCLLLHLEPTVSHGDTVDQFDKLGTLEDTWKHLHEEIYLVEPGDTNFNEENNFNPLHNANEQAPWARVDEEDPRITRVDVDSSFIWTWAVYAWDGHSISEDLDDNDGIYGAELFVNESLVDSFRFDRYRDRNGGYPPHWSNYYCTADTHRVCYKLFWEPQDTLRSWKVCVYDHKYREKCWVDTLRLHGCLGECWDSPTWSCLKSCYGPGEIGSSWYWPGPKGRTETPDGTIGHPEGVLGRMGGYAVYWGNHDPEAWKYEVLESEGDESSYQYIDSKPPGPTFRKVFRSAMSESVAYYYMVASSDSVFREEVPGPGIGSIVGVGQCRINGTACCTALDTTGSVLFIGESGGILDIVDVSDPRNPVVVATHHLSNLGLWDNIYDGPCELHYDGRLWAVCGNKGLAVLELSGGYQDIDTLCTYPASGLHASLFKCCEGGCDQGCSPGYLRTYVYYTTDELELLVLLLEYRPPGDPYLAECGEYLGRPGVGWRMRESYTLTSQDGSYLYVDSYDTDPSHGDTNNYYNGVHVVDISEPCAPSFAGVVHDPILDRTPSLRIWARDGDNLFAKWTGLDAWPGVLDISDPAAPTVVADWENLLFCHAETGGSRSIACNEGRLYVIGTELVHYPEPSRYGNWARWGGAIGYIVCPDGTPLFAAAFTDTGFDAAGDTSLVARTIDAADGKVYVTYKCAPDTDSVEDPPFHRLKVYLDHWEPMYGSGVTYNGEERASRIHLSPAWPNPSYGETVIDLSIPVPTRIRISVYDVTGRQVSMLAEGRYGPGTYKLTWDGRGHGSEFVAPGVYFIYLQLGSESATRKVVLLR